MGFFDRLFGADDNTQQQQPVRNAGAAAGRSEDEIAVERYRYLLRTAPPETIEQVHTEAFAKLTPEQRDLLFRELSDNAAEGDKPLSNEPNALAVSATRSELRNPGTMERTMGGGGGGGGGGGMGFGGMLASSLLGTVAGYVIGSALVSAFLPDPGATDASVSEGSEGSEGSEADASADGGADAGADTGGGDAGGDFGGGGFGDFGGGDFGGGDFGF